MKKFHSIAIVLGAVLLFFLIWRIGVDALWRDLSLLGWGFIPFIFIEGVAHLFHTLAARYCLSPIHRSISFFRFLGINLASFAINYVTPTATLGGEVVKGTLLSLHHRGPEAAMGVIIGKLSHALSQLLFVVVGSVFILWKIGLPAAGSVPMLVGSTALGAGIVGFMVVQKHGKLGAVVRWLIAHKIGGETLKKAANQINQVDEALKVFYRERPGDFLISILWHVVGMVCSIVKTWYFLFVIAEGSFFGAAGVFFLGTWFDLITFAIPLGIGVHEGGRVLAFKMLGYNLAHGLAFGIALRLEQLFWAGVGLLIYPALLVGKKIHE